MRLYMLSPNDIKEELSYAYLHAVASRAGFSVDRPSRDNDSIDAVIRCKGQIVPDALRRSPSIEVQLKASSQLNIIENKIHFALPVKNYDDLRLRSAAPRYLILLGLPANEAQWLQVTPDSLIAQKCAYWCSLLGAPPTDNEETQTVHVDCLKLFNLDVVRSLMEKAAKMEEVRHEL